MRVLITGGAGFIGSHLADAVLERGADVAVLDDLSAGDPARLNSAVSLCESSVTDAESVAEWVDHERPDLIFHLAGQINVPSSVADPATDAAVNVVGTINVLTAALAAGARVIFASTGGALYGRGAPVPSSEQGPIEPESPYGTSKYSAERYLGLYNRLHGTQHAVLRLANVYGPRQNTLGGGGVVAKFCGSAVSGGDPVVFGDGQQTRDFVFVGDVAAAFLAAADAGRPGTWNVGTGIETSVLELIGVLEHVAERPLSPRFAPARLGERQRSALDSALAAQELGWTARTSIRDGVAATFDWVRAGL